MPVRIHFPPPAQDSRVLTRTVSSTTKKSVENMICLLALYKEKYRYVQG